MESQGLRSVTLFCGSSLKVDPAFVEAAEAFGRLAGTRKAELIYGGGGIGLMGVAARAALESGASVVGVIPRFLVEREIAMLDVTELIQTKSMHERKAIMAERADAFVVLPGGLGTLDETFEILTWAQLGLHDKPVGILNVKGFFNGLLAHLEHTRKSGFIQDESMPELIVEESVAELWATLADRL
ncbi:MAG: TIGR00730 family Rossman fold protein [Myxococcota bacterium]